MSSLTRTDWRTIVRRIRDGKLTPFISDRVSNHLLPVNNGMLEAWAEDIGYSLGSGLTVTRLAQFLSVTMGDDLAAKEEFLSFAKRYVLESAPSESVRREIADTLGRGGLFRARLSEVVSRLGHSMPSGDGDTVDPIYVLANLPLPVYVTTSYYDFLEEALRAAGKSPRTQFCHWRADIRSAEQSPVKVNPLVRIREILAERFDEEELRTLCYDLAVEYDDLPGSGKGSKARELVAYLERYQRIGDLIAIGRQQRPDIPWLGTGELSPIARDPVLAGLTMGFEQDWDWDYEPSSEEPLVYHLHGLETLPASLVLTEDDYLDFLVKVSWDQTVIPPRIAEALTDSSLLLLGYQLQDWDFRVLFRGLITHKRGSRRLLSLAIQLAPTEGGAEDIASVEEAQDFLERYFDKANFKIYWGEPQEFMQELWTNWRL